MKQVLVGITLALGALAVAASSAAAEPRKKQSRTMEAQRDASAPARQRVSATARNASYSSAYSVGLDGRVEMCTGF